MKRLYAVVFGLLTITIQAQESERVENKVVEDSTTQIKTELSQNKTVTDTVFNINDLKDDVQAATIDQKWLDELYSNALYDTIYSTVSGLDYKPVHYPGLDTETLKARLAVLNAKTPFNIAYNPSLESVIKMFLKTRKDYINRMIGLSEFYFPMFEETLDRHNLPLEIKYLAIVESALKPRAKSHVGATGLWQFMYATGKMYGLDVSSYVDERNDPIKSTEAAAKYLSRLYKIFGDWDLALAAYNSGPGNVSKAIRRSGGYKNYWNLRRFLPRETAGYLPSFLATMYIIEYAEEHGFSPEKPPFHFLETDTVKVKQMITLDQVSEATKVNVEELQFLNPAYKLDVVPFVKDENYVLRLPIKAIGPFVNNEAEIYAHAKAEFDKKEKPLPQLFDRDNRMRYRIKSGDNLGAIARKFGVRVSQLKRWNGLRSNNIRAGKYLTIFTRQPSQRVTSTSTSTKTVKHNPPKNYTLYTVKTGDSLWSISKKFSGVTVQKLKEWNGINGSRLKPGMKLKISKG